MRVRNPEERPREPPVVAEPLEDRDRMLARELELLERVRAGIEEGPEVRKLESCAGLDRVVARGSGSVEGLLQDFPRLL